MYCKVLRSIQFVHVEKYVTNVLLHFIYGIYNPHCTVSNKIYFLNYKFVQSSLLGVSCTNFKTHFIVLSRYSFLYVYSMEQHVFVLTMQLRYQYSVLRDFLYWLK